MILEERKSFIMRGCGGEGCLQSFRILFFVQRVGSLRDGDMHL